MRSRFFHRLSGGHDRGLLYDIAHEAGRIPIGGVGLHLAGHTGASDHQDLVPRSFITNIKPGDTLRSGVPTLARGIAFGGDVGVARVDFSGDGGKNWQETQLGTDEGKYSFRQWQIRFNLPTPGNQLLMVRCTSSSGVVQPDTPNWNSAGFMRNVIEQTAVVVA